MLDSWRYDTPGCTNRIHLNNAGAALMPRPVIEAMRAHLSLEMQIGGYEAAAMQAEALDGFYTELASFLGTKPANIAHATNATDAYSRVLSAIPFAAGDVIITTRDDYVSNQLAFLQLQKRFGVQLVWTAARPGGGLDLEDLENQIRRRRPRLVAVTHVPTNSGLIQDVVAAGAICQTYNSLYLVDACQSAGQMPLNVQEIGCDFLTATFRKFLRGPRGIGFLYVSDRALDAGVEPLFVDLRGARWSADRDYEVNATARRFELWERSWALVAGAREAVRYARRVGPEKIQERVMMLAGQLRTLLSSLSGVAVMDQGENLCGIVTAALPDVADPKMLLTRLRDHRVNASISYRESARLDLQQKGVDWVLRFSPHYYNTDAELVQAVEKLEAVIGGRV